MTTSIERPQPANAETDAASGSRWYIHPITGERFISVTTVLSNIAKFGLTDWAARLSSEAAMDRLPWLVRCSRNRPCNLTKTDDACGQCPVCAVAWMANRHNEVRDDAADRGSKLHTAAEQHALFGPGAHIDADVKPYLAEYLAWSERYKPEHIATEMTVISRKWGYAGTLDAILRLGWVPKRLAHLAGKPLCVDLKTTKSIYLTHGWQVVAYAGADAVLLPDGTELPMPEIQGGLIVHIKRTVEQTGEISLRAQTREVFLTAANHARFVNALQVAEGLSAGLGSAISRPVNLKDN